MIFKVFWKETEFLRVERVEELYYTKVITENIKEVEAEGFPRTFIMNIKVVEEKLPSIILNRIPSDKRDESDMIDYINSTNCKRVTDFLSVKIED